MSESRTSAREKGNRAGAWEEKDGLYSEGRQVLGRRESACKENFPRRSRKKREEVSGRKSFAEESAESWFYSKSGQI